MKHILSGKAFWSYDYEVLRRNTLSDANHHFTGVSPFHTHEGIIILRNGVIATKDDERLHIPLGMIDQLYLGFDEVYPKTLIKNFGIFCQPLRLSLTDGKVLYLIIDYHTMTNSNQTWFDTIKTMLS